MELRTTEPMAAPPATSSGSAAWRQRRVLSTLVRAGAIVNPMAAGCGAAIAANHALPVTTNTALIVARTLVVVAISMTTIAAVDHLLRRFLPLATLFQLSLIFPDNAPSRFRLAVQAGSNRRINNLLQQTRDHGLDDDPQRAAEQVLVMVGAIGEHDRKTRGHSERVRLYADLIGKELRLPNEDRQKLQWAALLHDLGMIEIPSDVLNNKDPLNAKEWALIRTHPEAGRRLMRPLSPLLGEWAEGVWNHHERWDGTGYPRQLAGERIGRAAAIIAVADAFEVMTAARPYKKAMSVADARAELTRCAGTQFSPDIVRAFLSISLRRLRFAMGPLSALAHIPLLQRAVELPTMVNGAVTSAVASAAPSVAVGAMTVTGMFATGTMDSVPQHLPDETVVAAAMFAADAQQALPTTSSTTTAPAPSSLTTTRPTTTAPAVTVGGGEDDNAPTTLSPTTTLASAPSSTAPTTTVDRGATTSTTTTAPTTTRSTSTTASTTTTTTSTTRVVYTVNLRVSLNSNRSSAVALNGSTFEEDTEIFVFVSSPQPIANVKFFTYANPGGGGAPHSTDSASPYDLAGTASNGTAKPYKLTTTGNRAVTAVVNFADGQQRIVVGNFTVTA